MNNIPPEKSKMAKTFLKWGLTGVFIVILFLAIVLATIDLDEAKNILIEKVSIETGMKIEIESIGFGFAHGFGLKCSGVKVATPEGESYAVNQVHLLAEWAPLFSGDFKINSAALEQPKLTLKLPDKTKKKPASDKKKSEDSNPGSPNPVQSVQEKLKKSKFSVKNFEISDGQITLIHPRGEKSLLANLDLSLQIDVVNADQLDLVINSLKVSTGEFFLEGKAKAKNLTAKKDGELSIELEAHSFGLDDLKPVLAVFSYEEEALKKINVLQINNLSIVGNAPFAAIEKPKQLLQQSSGQIDLNIKKISLAGINPLEIEPLEGKGKWSKGVFEPDIKGKVLGSEFGIKGKLTPQKINTDIHWKELNITQLPLYKGKVWNPIAGFVSGKLKLNGPIPGLDKPFWEKLKGKLNFQFKKLVLTNQSQKISLPILEGSGIYKGNQIDYQIRGDIFEGNFKSIGKIKDLKNINTHLEYSNLDLSQITKFKTGIGVPTQGKASGTLKLQGPLLEKERLDGLIIKTSFDVSNLSIPIKHNKKIFPLKFPIIKGTANLNQKKLVHDIHANMLGGGIGATGKIKFGKGKYVDTKIKLKTIDLSALDQFIPSTSGIISGKVNLKGPLPEKAGKLPDSLKVDTVFDLENLRLPIEIAKKSVNAEFNKIKGNASLHRSKLNHNINAKLLGGNIVAKGNVSLKKTGSLRAIDTNLKLEHIDLAWVQRLKKGDWIPTSGKLTGNLKMKGPFPEGKNSPIHLRAVGMLIAKELILGTGKKKNGIKKAKLTLQDSEFTKILIELDKLQTAELQFEKIQTKFKIDSKKIDLIEGRIFPRNGQLKVAGSFLPYSGSYRLQFKGYKLKIEDFLKQLAGPLNFQGKLNGKLPEDSNKFSDIAKQLDGKLKIRLNDGTLPRLEALQTLLTTLNPTTALNLKKVGLSYNSLGGEFFITKGLVFTENFKMKNPQLNLELVGKANLAADTVNAQVKVMPLQMLDKTIKSIPLLGNILTGGKKDGLIETYFKINGTLSEPKVSAQQHKVLIEKPAAILKELTKIPKILSR